MKYTRDCPTCGKERVYKSKKSFFNSKYNNGGCGSCGVKKRPGLAERDAKVVELLQEGRTDREIAELLSIHIATVKRHLSNNGLPTDRALKIMRSRPKRNRYLSLNESIDKLLRRRWRALKSHAKKESILFDLTPEYLSELYRKQCGKCFYCDKHLTARVGEGYGPDRLSVDRIIPELGYVKGNIVLCTHKVNSVKNDLSLTDISEWMPGWYSRIMQKLNEQAV